jgi:hypothetical protein
MTHPLKRTFDRLSEEELDDLESVLTAVLQEAEEHAEYLLTEEARRADKNDWEDANATTQMRIVVLQKVLGLEPRPAGSRQQPP